MEISNPTTNIFTGQPLGLGPVKYGSEEISGWFYHKAVRVGDMIFDRVTGSAGMHINEYKQLFQYSDELIFK